jgi:hypothetical protein
VRTTRSVASIGLHRVCEWSALRQQERPGARAVQRSGRVLGHRSAVSTRKGGESVVVLAPLLALDVRRRTHSRLRSSGPILVQSWSRPASFWSFVAVYTHCSNRAESPAFAGLSSQRPIRDSNPCRHRERAVLYGNVIGYYLDEQERRQTRRLNHLLVRLTWWIAVLTFAVLVVAVVTLVVALRQ